MLKLYGILWAILAFAAVATTITGNLTDMALVVFGFITFAMIFMGMISVLPMTIAHPAPQKLKAEPVKRHAKVFVHARRLSTR
jgi:hypothetical protein